jgi:hypothetical protein
LIEQLVFFSSSQKPNTQISKIRSGNQKTRFLQTNEIQNFYQEMADVEQLAAASAELEQLDEEVSG